MARVFCDGQGVAPSFFVLNEGFEMWGGLTDKIFGERYFDFN